MEEGWQTKTWWNRMFASISGMIVTNAYFAYEFEYAQYYEMQNNPKLAFKEFMDKLSYYMVNQTRLNAYQNRTRNRAARNDEVIVL